MKDDPIITHVMKKGYTSLHVPMLRVGVDYVPVDSSKYNPDHFVRIGVEYGKRVLTVSNSKADMYLSLDGYVHYQPIIKRAADTAGLDWQSFDDQVRLFLKEVCTASADKLSSLIDQERLTRSRRFRADMIVRLNREIPLIDEGYKR